MAVSRAVILAAGNGDRFKGTTHSKLLAEIGGVPLISRTIQASVCAGIRVIDVIVGYDAEAVRDAAESALPRGVVARFHYNGRWREENGVSALVARPHVGRDRFALLMGDHVFDWRVLERLLQTDVAPDESLLAVDRSSLASPRADEATKVRLDGERITDIGKQVTPFDALDTGVFVFAPRLFDALADSVVAGDTSLSGGVTRLAAQGLMRGIESDGSPWCDIDTVEDLEQARTIA